MEKPSFVCFICKNGTQLSSGESIRDAIRHVQNLKNVIAVGVNCVKPKYILELIEEIKKETKKPIVVYPNGGDTWNAQTKVWEVEKDKNGCS